VLGLEIK
jgi:Na+/H+ antiporter NhaA